MRNAVNVTTFAGARIAGVATYTPSHIKAGMQKPISAKAEFNIYQNAGDKKFQFRVTAWGKMADVVARSGAAGKEVTIIASVGSFEARVWMPMPDGSRQFVVKPDGTPLTTQKVGFTIQQLVFGADSAKTIAEEIAMGKRQPGWNIAGHADNIAWKNTCAQRNAEQYVQGSAVFGLAKVFLPEGAQIVANTVANNVANSVIPTNGYTAPVTGAATQYVANPSAVNATIPATPVGGGYVAPVIVNGQNMGMPVQQNVPNAQVTGAGYVM